MRHPGTSKNRNLISPLVCRQGEENMLLEFSRTGAMDEGLPDRSHSCRGCDHCQNRNTSAGREWRKKYPVPLSFYPQIFYQGQPMAKPIGSHRAIEPGDAVYSSSQLPRAQRRADNGSWGRAFKRINSTLAIPSQHPR